MRAATRYLLRQLTGPMLFITVTLSGVIWLTQSLRIVDKIINDGISIGTFLYLTGLLFPTVLMIILPIALFCAVIYAYSRLLSESELVVLWAAGFSSRSLARPALMLAGVVMLICYVLMLYLMPLGNRTFKGLQWDFRANLANLVLQEGAFNTPVPGLTVYIRSRSGDGELQGILVHDNRDPGKPVTMMAESGMLIRSDDGPRFVMVKGNRQQVEPEQRQLSLLYFDSYALALDTFTKPAGERWLEPGERFLSELIWPAGTSDDVQNHAKLVIEANRRIATPLYVPALALIALAAVMSGEFNRRGRTHRIAAASAIAVALQLGALGMTNLAVKMPALIPLMYLAPILAGCGAAYAMARRPRRRPGVLLEAS